MHESRSFLNKTKRSIIFQLVQGWAASDFQPKHQYRGNDFQIMTSNQLYSKILIFLYDRSAYMVHQI